MNSRYIFVLGRDEELSYLELKLYLKNNYNIDIKFNEEVIIVRIDNFDAKKAMLDLGGIVKIGREIKTFDELYVGNKNKINYGISDYDEDDLKKELKDYFKSIKLKAILKKSHKGNILMPSEVIKHDLINNGVEVIRHKDFLGKTIEVFDPRGYKERDKRPYFDEKKVISIRLAKIMINLSQVKENELLLDCFCGIGTILQEAMLRNINVIGVEIDNKTIEGAKKNLEWIKKKYKIGNYKLVKGDSRNLSKLVKKVNVVVTEPYLGPFLKNLPDNEEARKIVNELEKLYGVVFNEISKIIERNGRVVIVMPRFLTRQGKVVRVNFSRIIKKNGFKLDRGDNKVEIPIIYRTSKGKIEREIYILKQ